MDYAYDMIDVCMHWDTCDGRMDVCYVCMTFVLWYDMLDDCSYVVDGWMQ